MDYRMPGASQALRDYPEQAAALARWGRLNLSEAELNAKVVKAAAASPQAHEQWDGFFKSAARGKQADITPPVVPAVPPPVAPTLAPPVPKAPVISPKPVVGKSLANRVLAAGRNPKLPFSSGPGSRPGVLDQLYNTVRGGAYTAGGGLGTAVSGLGSLGAEAGYQTGLVSQANRDGMHAATGVMANGMTAGMKDLVGSPFGRPSAVSAMTNENQQMLRDAGMPGAARVVGAADSTAGIASNAAALGGAARLLPGPLGAGARSLTGYQIPKGIAAVGGTLAAAPATGAAFSVGGNLADELMYPGRAVEQHQNLLEQTQNLKLQNEQMRMGNGEQAGPAQPQNPPGLNSVPPSDPNMSQPPVATPAAQPPAPPPPATPQQAQSNMATANKSIQDLANNNLLSPEQKHAEFAQHADSYIANHAAVTGQDPTQLKQLAGTLMTDGKLDSHDFALFQQAAATNPSVQAQPGLMQQFGQLPMHQQIGLALGLPMAIMGIGQSLFGEGGMGSLLMTILGLGGAAHGMGLLSGEGPLGHLSSQLPGMSSIRDLLGMKGGQGSQPDPRGIPRTAPVGEQAGSPPGNGANQRMAIPEHFWNLPEEHQRPLFNQMLNADPAMAKEFDNGAIAYNAGRSLTSNPYGKHVMQFLKQDPEASLANAASQHGISTDQLRRLLALRQQQP